MNIRIFLIGWIVFLAFTIVVCIFFFTKWEYDYNNIQRGFNTNGNKKIINYLEITHYIPTTKLTFLANSESRIPPTKDYTCKVASDTANRLMQTPTVSVVGNYFKEKMITYDNEIIIICNGQINNMADDSFFKVIAPAFDSQQQSLAFFKSLAISKHTARHPNKLGIRTSIEDGLFGLLFLSIGMLFVKWKDD